MSRRTLERKKLTWNQKCKLCMLPFLAGTLLFALLPFIRVIYYSFLRSQFRREFVWLENYKKTWENEYFQLALRNSVLLILKCVPILIGLAIVISLLLVFVLNKNEIIRSAFVIPMVIPTASIVVVWKLFFGKWDSELPLYLLFIWKNLGICVILLMAEFSSIQKEIYEAAILEGAPWWKIDLGITLPIAAPTILFTVLLSIMNSYKVFKESYLYYGTNYPPDYAYTLQYYMNNHFLKLNYQSLAASAVYTTILSAVLIVVGLRIVGRYRE